MIFVITEQVSGPSGHGEPGRQYQALADDGSGYAKGTPYPAFSTWEKAEQFREDNSISPRWSSIQGLEVQ